MALLTIIGIIILSIAVWDANNGFVFLWNRFAAVVALILALFWIGHAVAQEHRGHPAEDIPIHNKFYRTWMMPDNPRISCCSDEDCAPVQAKYADGNWFALKDDQWVKIPPSKVEYRTDSPDGRSHLCGRWYSGTFNVFCFIAGIQG